MNVLSEKYKISSLAAKNLRAHSVDLIPITKKLWGVYFYTVFLIDFLTSNSVFEDLGIFF